MASCCPPGSAPYLAADHKDQGSTRSIDGISYYQVGSGSSGLLLVPDVWGWNGGRTRAIADEFAKKGLSVWVPKILSPFEGGTDGDGFPPNFDLDKRGSEFGPLVNGEWHVKHTVPKVAAVVKSMKNHGVEKIGFMGFCYGAWVGMHLAKDVKFACCVSPHPSIHVEGMCGGDPAEVAKGSKCPWAFFPCGEVGQPGADPDIYDAEGAVFKALEAKFKGKNETKRFTKMPHGFVPRGNIKSSEFNCGTGDDVKAAVQECVEDIVKFFQKNNLLPRPPPLKKPRFVKVKTIKPDSKGLNLLLKCKDCTPTEGSDEKKSWTAVLGDETGSVSFSLRSEEDAALCKPGAALRVQNARVVMVKGYIRVIVDKWAVLAPAEKELTFEINGTNDVSCTEYELMAANE